MAEDSSRLQEVNREEAKEKLKDKLAEGQKLFPQEVTKEELKLDSTINMESQFVASEAVLARVCPSCDEPVTVEGDKCNRCGANLVTRRTISGISLSACSLLVVGILFLALASVTTTPITPIDSLTLDDNYKHIRIKGVVSSVPDFYMDKYGYSGTLRFEVNDTTGEITVRSYTIVTKRFIDKDTLDNPRIPGIGDTVDVQGQAIISETSQGITIKSERDLSISKREYQPMAISVIDTAGQYSLTPLTLVEISGKIIKKSNYTSAVSLYVEDGKGHSANVYIPVSVIQLTGVGDVYRCRVGDNVTARGALEWYKDHWEIIPQTTKNFICHAEPIVYNKTTVTELMANVQDYNGKHVELTNVVITGTTTYTFLVADSETSPVNVTVYVAYGATCTAPKTVGQRVNVRGIFVPYGNSWEVKIEAGTDDQVVPAGGN